MKWDAVLVAGAVSAATGTVAMGQRWAHQTALDRENNRASQRQCRLIGAAPAQNLQHVADYKDGIELRDARAQD